MQMRYDLLVCYGIIAAITVLSAILPIPVPIHMVTVTTVIVYLGCQQAAQNTLDDSAGKSPELPVEKMERSDVFMFPLIGSCVLFGLYCLFKVFPKWLMISMFKFYFMLAGVWVVAQRFNMILVGFLTEEKEASLRQFRIDIPFMKVNDAIRPVIVQINEVSKKISKALEPAQPIFDQISAVMTSVSYKIVALIDGQEAADAQKKADEARKAQPESAATTPDNQPRVTSSTNTADWLPAIVSLDGVNAISYGAAIVVAILYLITNYWLLNNIFGVCFSLQAIELLNVGSYMNGAILLSGLFFYDIFWVFGTDVMVTVAKSVDAPIKLLFPAGDKNSMLGLGDIVIPGAFIALMLRYDIFASKQINHRNEKDVKLGAINKIMNKIGSFSFITVSTDYFNTVMIGYVFGLITTLAVMYIFKAAQPALLYLVPACLLFTAGVAAIFGQAEFNQVVNYVDSPAENGAAKAAAAEDVAPAPAVAAQ